MANAFDISLLIRLLPFLSQAKNHFFQAGREALLGVDKLLEMWIDQYADPKSAPLQGFEPIANNIKDFVDIMLKELPETAETKKRYFHEMKEAVLDSILDVIAEEIIRTEDMEPSEKKRHKLEALRAIEKVIRREKPHDKSDNMPHDQGEDLHTDYNDEPMRTRTTTRVTKLRNIQGRRS
jgi:hypothetical protein